jgi:hypothetical protein
VNSFRNWAAASASCLLLLASPASAEGGKPGCGEAGRTDAATPPPKGADSGTQPGASSSGWSGGLGGNYTGTNPQGPTAGSNSDQPATAKGLDPTKQAGTEKEGC